MLENRSTYDVEWFLAMLRYENQELSLIRS